MASRLEVKVDALAREGLSVLHRSRAGLDSATGMDGADESERCRALQELCDRLFQMAGDPSVPQLLSDIFLDWRVRVASHILVARTLSELDVHPDLARELLDRGLDEAIAEAPHRFAEARTRLLESSTGSS